MQTTQGYCRVTEKRPRAAVAKLVSHQFDRPGNKIWTQARQLLEHEHACLRDGQVSVPYGICIELSNVKAGGHQLSLRRSARYRPGVTPCERVKALWKAGVD
ncbi:hypothetical protein [Streptomyces sp. NPDC052693]|uniref:hypothetical protein n=1 Tax=Streptomyces sp. NPDC052693 TaxID=3155814 RepID=UPI00343AA157